MNKVILFFILIIALCSPCFAQSNMTESLTITTYYPAPYGVYRNLKLNPTDVVPGGSALSRGVMYYNNSTDNLKIWTNSGWVNLTGGGNGTGYWAENTTTHNIYNTNSGGNVGIGSTAPTKRLVVGDDSDNNFRCLGAEGLGIALNNYTGFWLHNTLFDVEAMFEASNRLGALPTEGPHVRFGAITNHPVSFYTNNVKQMTILPNGNVGIGTENPQQKLDVAGNINATGNVSVGGSLFAGCRRYSQTINGWQVVSYCPAGTTVISGGCHWPTGGNAQGAHPIYNSGTGRWGWECNRDAVADITVDLLCCKIDVQ